MSARPHPPYNRIAAGGSWWSPARQPVAVEIDSNAPFANDLVFAFVGSAGFVDLTRNYTLQTAGVVGDVVHSGTRVLDVGNGGGNKYGSDSLSTIEVFDPGTLDLTLLFSFKTNVSPAWNRIISTKNTYSEAPGFEITTYNADPSSIYVACDRPVYGYTRYTSSLISVHTKRSVYVCEMDSASTSCRLWVDGAYIGSGPLAITSYSRIMALGSDANLSEWTLAGQLEYAYIFKGARGDSINALYSDNPYAFLRPVQRRIWVPVSTGGGGSSHTITPSGGMTFAGAVTMLRARAFQVSGGVTLAGNVAMLRSRLFAPSGGGTFGGSAPFSTGVTHTITPSGGMTTGGVATMGRVRQFDASGGMTAGGSAPFTVHSAVHTIGVSGGMTFGGSSPFSTSGGAGPAGNLVRNMTETSKRKMAFKPTTIDRDV